MTPEKASDLAQAYTYTFLVNKSLVEGNRFQSAESNNIILVIPSTIHVHTHSTKAPNMQFQVPGCISERNHEIFM